MAPSQPPATIKDQWSQNLASEVAFWEEWFSARGGQWPDEYRARLDAATPLEPDIASLLKPLPDSVVKILDVGAGPITRIGYALPGKEVQITAVDPLADAYNAIIDSHHISPPVRTARCDGEVLTAQYPANFYDLAIATNSLDHAYDPQSIIAGMLELVKPDRYVYLRHARNEAVNAQYTGLHQWNFDAREGKPVLWNPSHICDIAELLREKAEVRFEATDSWIQIWAKKVA